MGDGNLENMNNLLELSITSRIGTKLTEEWESILRKYLMKKRENKRKKHNYESLGQCVDHNINYYYHKDGYCQFELYELMNIFWNDISPKDPPFESIFFLESGHDAFRWAIKVPENINSRLMKVLED